MKFLHYITEWKHLKLKNIILNDENDTLAMENVLLERMNKAYEIENFKSGRVIAKLRSEKANLIEAFYLQHADKVSKEDVLKLQEELSFAMKHGLRLTPALLEKDSLKA